MVQSVTQSAHHPEIADAKQALLHTITDALTPHYHFDDVVVVARSQASPDHHRILLASVGAGEVSNEVYPATLRLGTLNPPYLLAQWNRSKPRVEALRPLLAQYPADPALLAMQALGMAEMLVVRLCVADEVVGSLHLLARTPGLLGHGSLTRLKTLAGQVARPVVELLKADETRQQIAEKDQLLSLGHDMASIRDRQDLWQVIVQKLRLMAEFDDAGVVVFDEARQTVTHLLATPTDDRRLHPHFGRLFDQPQPVANSPFEQWLATSEDWFSWTVAAMQRQYSHHPGLQLMLDTGLTEAITFPLIWNGKTMGLFSFFFAQPSHLQPMRLTFYRTIANQIAVAVANIRANEALAQATATGQLLHQQLLTISTAVTPFRNRNQMMEAVGMQLRRIAPVDSFYFITHTNQLTGFHVFTEGMMEAVHSHQAVQAFLNDADKAHYFKINVAGQPTTTTYEKNLRTTRFRYADLPGKLLATMPLARAEQEAGMREGLILPLTINEERVGKLILATFQADAYSDSVLLLLEKAAEFMAVGLGNVLIFEEMCRVRAEIEHLNAQLQEQNLYLIAEVQQQHNLGDLVGNSTALQPVFEGIRLVAPTDTTVLITGETGTGKELVARAIHQASSRHNKPMIKLNCAALPAQLIESELFGHERGAFTGATDRRIGKFEIANGSTLFLDEVGELPIELQAKLLRALQEREIERLGSNKSIPVDVRIIAATNRNLEQEMATGRFRADLYYRLSVFPMLLPALRNRIEDIPLLTAHIIDKLNRKLNRKLSGVSKAVQKQLQAYDWPGNIRELEHTLERSAIMTQGPVILHLLLPVDTRKMGNQSDSVPVKTLANVEREYILATLHHCNGRIRGKGGSAELLGMPPSTLESKMAKLGIHREHVLA